jgi:hypothetical protein
MLMVRQLNNFRQEKYLQDGKIFPFMSGDKRFRFLQGFAHIHRLSTYETGLKVLFFGDLPSYPHKKPLFISSLYKD